MTGKILNPEPGSKTLVGSIEGSIIYSGLMNHDDVFTADREVCKMNIGS